MGLEEVVSLPSHLLCAYLLKLVAEGSRHSQCVFLERWRHQLTGARRLQMHPTRQPRETLARGSVARLHLTELGMVVAYSGAVLPRLRAKDAVSSFPGHLIAEAQLLGGARNVLVPVT